MLNLELAVALALAPAPRRPMAVAALGLALTLGAGTAEAVPIGLGGFDGTETLVDFNAATIGNFLGSYTAPGITVTPESGAWMIQSGGGGIIGTTGAAFNSNSGVGNGDVTITFDNPVSRFGMVFGTSIDATLSAVVAAFDSSNVLVETQSFPSFSNTFVGFQFSTAVTSILIDRTDSTTRFTFVDDIRYLASVESAPEPSALALLATGLLGFAWRRRSG